jgi:hypothetical protein
MSLSLSQLLSRVHLLERHAAYYSTIRAANLKLMNEGESALSS